MDFQERLEQINYEGKIPEVMICPISKKIMNHPVIVVLSDKNLLFDRDSIYRAFAAENFPSQIKWQGINIPQTTLIGNKCSVLKDLIENFVSYKEGKKDRSTYIMEKEELLVDPITMNRIEWPCILSSGQIYDGYTLGQYYMKNPKKNTEGVILDPMSLTPLTQSDLDTIKKQTNDPTFSSLINQSKQLLKAAKENNVEQTQSCIDEDCDLEISDSMDQTPLLLTIKNGANDCFELLLKNGAKPTDEALMEAAHQGQFAMMTRLLEEGADINAKDQDGNNLLMPVLTSGEEPTEQSFQQINEMIHLLMEKGVDFKHKNLHGDTILFPAIITENYQLADELIAKGLDINVKIKAREDVFGPPIPGGTLLTLVATIAAQMNSGIDNNLYNLSKIIQYMIDKDADLTATTDSGKTALDILREGKRDDLVKILDAAQVVKPVDTTILAKVRRGLQACGDTGFKIDDILLDLQNFIKYEKKEQAIVDKHQKILNNIVATLNSLDGLSEEQLNSACSKGHPLHQVLSQTQGNDIFLTAKSKEWSQEILNTDFGETKTMMPGKNNY